MARPQKFTPEDVMARNIDMSGQSIKKQHTVAQCADALRKAAGLVEVAVVAAEVAVEFVEQTQNFILLALVSICGGLGLGQLITKHWIPLSLN